jgi:hypothetical protein
LTEEVRYRRNPDFIFRKIVDELVLVPIRQDVADMDCIYTLNGVGAFLWERIDGQATPADLQEAVTHAYAAEAGAVAADVVDFLHDLESIGAIHRV